jgi:hypothetical protein
MAPGPAASASASPGLFFLETGSYDIGKLALNSRSSCLYLLRAGMTSMHHLAWLITWELVRNAETWAPPTPTESEIQRGAQSSEFQNDLSSVGTTSRR